MTIDYGISSLEPSSFRKRSYVTSLPLIKPHQKVCEGCMLGKKLVENQSGKHIKILRTDGGGEYTSRKFRDFTDHNELIHDVTVPYMS
ncbi:hypothetical protein CR513_56131, partial [Mucuna pruriens]